MAAYKKILVTTDFSDAAELGLREAERVAADQGAELSLLHVLEDATPATIDAASRERILGEHRLKAGASLEEMVAGRTVVEGIKTMVAVGDDVDEILMVAADEQADLIVMASHGRTALGRVLLGSTTQAVLHRAKCPVLVVPAHS